MAGGTGNKGCCSADAVLWDVDAYTHLGITSNNEWGLKASMYGSKAMLAEKKDGGQQTLKWGNRR